MICDAKVNERMEKKKGERRRGKYLYDVHRNVRSLGSRCGVHEMCWEWFLAIEEQRLSLCFYKLKRRKGKRKRWIDEETRRKEKNKKRKKKEKRREKYQLVPHFSVIHGALHL